jgi:hypothetical protein
MINSITNTQNRAIPIQRKVPIKSRVPEPQYLNKTDAGQRNCPVHKQGPNDFGRKVKIIL